MVVSQVFVNGIFILWRGRHSFKSCQLADVHAEETTDAARAEPVLGAVVSLGLTDADPF